MIYFFGYRLRELVVNVENLRLSESFGANVAADLH
jgi:hypothetical protein